MNEVSLVPVQELRANLTLSPGLARWTCAVEDGAGLPDNLPHAVVEEAKRLSLLADRLMTPVVHPVITPWLAVIAGHYAAIQKARSKEESNAWARSIELTMEGMPNGVFTKANLGEVLARYAFWPTAAQIMEVLAPDRDVLERRARALRTVANVRI